MTDLVRAPGSATSAQPAMHPEPPASVETGSLETGSPADPAISNGLADYASRPENGACTQAQLRRFVKSRPYVPLHELRRRFGIGGSEDEVSPVAVDGRTLFVGLPDREAGMVGELIRAGDAGYELLLDPDGPMIVGIWPTRPVQRS